MTALEKYYCEPNVLQTTKMMAVKKMKWIIGWKRLHFAYLKKNARSVAGSSPSRQF